MDGDLFIAIPTLFSNYFILDFILGLEELGVLLLFRMLQQVHGY